MKLKKRKKRGRPRSPDVWHQDLRDSLWELKYFIAVAETESIEAGAERVRKQPSPVSNFIWKFQHDEVGIELFNHRGNAVTLTVAGKAFLDEARKIVRAYEDAKHRARAKVGVPPKKIHIGYAGSPTDEFLEPAIRLYERTFASTEVVRHQIAVPDCFDELIARLLDLVLLVEPKQMNARLEFKKLTEYPVRCVLGKTHRLASGSFVRVNELKNEQFLTFKDDPQYHRYLRDWFKPHGFTPRVSDDYDDLETLLPAVAAGHGIAILLGPAQIEARRLGAEVKFLPTKPQLSQTNVGALFVPPLVEHCSKFVCIVEDCIRQIANKRQLDNL